jgi:hypothetical protein
MFNRTGRIGTDTRLKRPNLFLQQAKALLQHVEQAKTPLIEIALDTFPVWTRLLQIIKLCAQIPICLRCHFDLTPKFIQTLDTRRISGIIGATYRSSASNWSWTTIAPLSPRRRMCATGCARERRSPAPRADACIAFGADIA